MQTRGIGIVIISENLDIWQETAEIGEHGTELKRGENWNMDKEINKVI